jgi:ABC-type transport system involved in cytochrome c biogenesis permease subunit
VRLLGPVAVLAHLAGLVALAAQIHRSPFSTASQALSFLAFALVALYLVLEATSRVATHGGGFYAVAALLAAIGVPGLLTESAATGSTPLRESLLTVHVGLALLGTAAVLAGGLLAVGYLQAYRRVKRHEVGGGDEGPSLSGFARLSRRASALGLLLLGPSLALGVVAAARHGEAKETVPLIALTAALFVLLAVAGFLWWRRPLRGALAAWLNVSGTVLVVVAFALVHPLVTGGR